MPPKSKKKGVLIQNTMKNSKKTISFQKTTTMYFLFVAILCYMKWKFSDIPFVQNLRATVRNRLLLFASSISRVLQQFSVFCLKKQFHWNNKANLSISLSSDNSSEDVFFIIVQRVII